MAFWLKKKTDEIKVGTYSDGKGAGLKKKDDKKASAAKRIDNLRIAQQLKITLKSIGSPNEFIFLTKDLSSTGAFVICQELRRYPFQQLSTILDATVELASKDEASITRVNFLCKIARVVEGVALEPSATPGFGIRIIQISHDQRQIFEQFISRHGAPDLSASSLEGESEDTDGLQRLDITSLSEAG